MKLNRFVRQTIAIVRHHHATEFCINIVDFNFSFSVKLHFAVTLCIYPMQSV